jgi:hypothetical protein
MHARRFGSGREDIFYAARNWPLSRDTGIEPGLKNPLAASKIRKTMKSAFTMTAASPTT